MKKKAINAVIQARMGSTRLPGKVLLEIEGIPILEHIIHRLNSISGIDKIIIATSDKEDDDAIFEFCKSRDIPCVRGSEENVLERFGIVAGLYPAEVYIRATGDNPMIDVGLIKDMLHFFDDNNLTYTCYKNYPIGSGVEIFTSEALAETIKKADKPYELEHVTPYMYQRMNERRVQYFESPTDDSMIRMTVDTEEDLVFAKEIFKRLYHHNPVFGISEIKKLMEHDSSLKSINSDVHQKKLGE